MKIVKVNSLTTIILGFLIIGLAFCLPTFLIESLWNTTVGKTYNDISIEFWQAFILWLAVLIFFNILGVFKFEFAVETEEAFNKELLKKKLESLNNLQNKTEEKPESTIEPKRETKD